jgi:hypothetical protein
MVNHIVDSLEDAIINPAWRETAIEEAREGWRRLCRRLARDDVPHELKVISARLGLLFEIQGFPTCGPYDPTQVEENQCVEANIRGLIEEIDGIYTDISSAPNQGGVADA